MSSKTATYLKLTLKVIAAFLLFLVMLILLLRLPIIQTKLANFAVNIITKTTNTEIKIDKVALNFIDNISAKGVYLADENGDTLLYAKKLNVDIGIFKLLKNTVDIDYVELADSKINVYQKEDSTFSFQFLIEAFSSDTTATESAPWVIEIDKIRIKNADYNFDLIQAKNNLKVKDLLVKSDEIDFEKMLFSIDKIEVNQMNLSSYWKEDLDTEIVKIDSATKNENIVFPLNDLPISLVCKQFKIKESNVIYQNGRVVKSNFFNVNDIHAQKINIEIQDIIVNKNEAKLEIANIAINLNNQFKIEEANAELIFANNEIALNDLYLKTNNSELEIEGSTSYKKFEDLMNFKDGTPIDVNLKNLDLAIQDAIYFMPFLDTVNYLQNLKSNQLKLSAYVKGTIDNIDISAVNVAIKNTNLDLSGNIQNALDIDNLSFNNIKIKANTNIDQLRTILGSDIILHKYNYFGNINLDASFDGSLSQLDIKKFDLISSGILRTSFNGQVSSLLDMDKLKYDLNVKQLKTGFADLEIIVDSLPDMLQNFEYLNYVGAISGGVRNYTINGNLLSSLGSASSNISLAFNNDFSNADYEGNIQLDTFNLGKLLGVDSLGAVSLDADLKGEGIALEDLDAKINAVITEVSYNNYNYKDIKIDGEMIQSQFLGLITVEDKNLKFNFDGNINFNDSLPDLDFKADLIHINTLALNLTNFPFEAKLKIESKLKGLALNDIVGNVTIKDIYFQNEEESWSTDSITFVSKKNEGFEKYYQLKSVFLNAELEGNYDLLQLPQIALAVTDKYLKISPVFLNDSSFTSIHNLSNENIHLDLALSHPEKVVSFFNINLEKLDTAFLHLEYDAPSSVLDLELFSPAVQYNSFYVDSIYWKASGLNDKLTSDFKIDSISLTESIYIPGIQTTLNFENQQGEVQFFINNSNGKYSLALNTNLKSDNERILIDIQSPLTLNGKKWNVENNDEAYIGNNEFYIPKFSLVNGNESLVFNFSDESKSINFSQFNLNNFTELIEIDSTEITGLIDGFLSLDNSAGKLDAKGKLVIDNIKINDLMVGNLSVKLSKQDDIVKTNMDLKDGGNFLNAKAMYNEKTKITKAKVTLLNFNVATIAPLVTSYAQNLEGSLTGELEAEFIEKGFEVQGAIDFSKVKAFVVPVGTNYALKKGRLEINNKTIRTDFNIADEINRNAFLTGQINHNNFSDFKFDLNFSTTAFTFLNSKKKEDEYIYGKLVAKLEAKITGGIDLPIIKGDITTIDQSDLSIQLLSDKAVATQEDYVIFLNGSDYNDTQIDSIANDKYKINSSIDLDLTVNINEKATLRVVIDPLTGDNLVVNGSGTLAVKVLPYGDVYITGVYKVNSGLYSFSFQQLLRKKFEITKGSELKFAGNPMNATLNIQAAYKADASTYALIESETASLSSEEQQALKKKSEVNVLLNMSGKLSEPVLAFDINIPESSNSVTSSVTRALNKIKQNESELNKQVFSLLLFNSFTSTSNSGNISSTGTSTAVRSVGNLINSQLNKLAGKADGLEINFNLDQYQDQFSDDGGQITDVELGISQSLFNDKIVISVGGNVGLESGQENGALSNVAGDFILSYKITEDGKYNVKVFQKSDYDALNDANVWKTGAGFTYQNKFGRLRKIKKRNE